MKKIPENVLNYIKDEAKSILKEEISDIHFQHIKQEAERIGYGRVIVSLNNGAGKIIIELRDNSEKIDIITEQIEQNEKITITTEQRKRFIKELSEKLHPSKNAVLHKG